MKLPKLIPTRIGAIIYITQLYDQDRLYHFDDEPGELLDPTGKKLFSDAELVQLDIDIRQIFELLPDPFEVSLTLVDPTVLSCTYR